MTKYTALYEHSHVHAPAEFLNGIAISVQCLVRKRFAMRHAAKLRMRAYEERRIRGARRIQCLARRLHACKRVKVSTHITVCCGAIRLEPPTEVYPSWQVRRIMLQHLAATLVQGQYRLYLARKCMRKEVAVRNEIRRNRAAIPIQGLSLFLRLCRSCTQRTTPPTSDLSQQSSAASCTVAL